MLERSLESEAYSKVVKRAHAQKTRFFINLAHETKTPLTLMSNYLDEYAKKHDSDGELSVVLQSMEKLKQDMVNFLDFEKLEHGKVTYDHRRVVDISDSLTMICSLFVSRLALT